MTLQYFQSDVTVRKKRIPRHEGVASLNIAQIPSQAPELTHKVQTWPYSSIHCSPGFFLKETIEAFVLCKKHQILKRQTLNIFHISSYPDIKKPETTSRSNTELPKGEAGNFKECSGFHKQKVETKPKNFLGFFGSGLSDTFSGVSILPKTLVQH